MTLKTRLEKLEASNNGGGLHIVAGRDRSDFKAELEKLAKKLGKAPAGLIICVRRFTGEAA